MGQDSCCRVSRSFREAYNKLKQLFASPHYLAASQSCRERETEAKWLATLQEESDGMPGSDCRSLI